MRSIHLILVAIALSTLTACGGGGGGGGGSSVPADFALSASTMSFNAVQNGPAPPAQTITVSATGGTFGTNGTVYVSSSISGSAVERSDVTNCGGSTCSLVVTPRSNAPPGSYQSIVTVTGCTNFQCVTPVGTPKNLTATLTVASGTTLSSPATVTIASAPNAVPLAQQILVQSTDTNAAWTASVTYEVGPPGWLAAIPSGTGSQQVLLQASASPAGLYRARVSFQPVSGGVGSSTIVELSVRAPRLAFVAPYVGVEGQGGRVLLRGSGFSAFVVPQVMFGATPGTNAALLSDTEIGVDAPALPTGRYAVTLSSGALTMTGSPELVVITPPAFAYAAIARSGSPSGVRRNQILYDAERQKIFLYDPDSLATPGSPLPPSPGLPASRIERYRFASGTWNVDEPMGFALGGDTPFTTSSIALSPDGRELLRTARQTITRFDPSSISPAASLPLETLDARSALGADVALMGAAMANDGSFVGPAYRSSSFVGIVYRYDVLERAFHLLASPASWTHAEFRTGLPTPTGRTVSLVYTGAGLPRSRFDFSASSGTVTEAPNFASSLTRIWTHSRDEAVWAWGLDEGGGNSLWVTAPDPVLGGATALFAVHHSMDAAVVAPNGKRAYYYETVEHRVHALDLEHPQQIINHFPEVAVSAPIDPPGTGAQLLITPDGGSLIIAGKDRVIVMPAP
jgi:hypothetical protein